MKKRAEIRKARRCMVGTALAALILLLMVLLGAMKITAMTAKAGDLPDTREKLYKSVLVEPQDCLWSIAAREMGEEWVDIRAYVQEVRQINGISDDHLTAGAYLVLPYYVTMEEAA